VCSSDLGGVVRGKDGMAMGLRIRLFGGTVERTRRAWELSRTGTSFAMTMAVLCGVLAGTSVPATAAPPSPPPVPHDKSTAVTATPGHYQKPKAMPHWKAGQTTWPSGTADTVLKTAPGAAKPSAATASPSTSTNASADVQAGSLPVWLGPSTATDKGISPTSSAPGRVHVQIAPRSTTTGAGVDGVILSLSRSDGVATTGSVHFSLSYAGFADAYGGDWAARLKLVALPACALSTPTSAECRTQTPIDFENNQVTRQLSANVTLITPQGGAAPTAGSGTGVPMQIIAATSTTSAGSGDFTATSLKASGSWTAGGSSDGFDWSYPIPVPAVPGNLAPKVGLSYSSQSVDGLTSATNSQASWIGDGWEYSPGYIERSYTSCHQNPTGPTKTNDYC